MIIDILTLFPEMFKGPFDTSMLKKAKDNGIVEINIHNLRDWATDKHKTVDDRPFGGGVGMILKVDIVDKALKDIKTKKRNNELTNERVILLSPQGKTYNQKKARKMAKIEHLILIAGHYEGFDERISEHLVDEEVSIGNYVLTGGEIPAMVLVDSVVRLLPGVLDPEATMFESFSEMKTDNSKIENLLDFPQYTRPEVYRNWKVPEILLSGNHNEIKKWRQEKAFEKTKKLRSNLI